MKKLFCSGYKENVKKTVYRKWNRSEKQKSKTKQRKLWKYLFILGSERRKSQLVKLQGYQWRCQFFLYQRMLLIIFCSKLRVLLWREGVYNEALHFPFTLMKRFFSCAFCKFLLHPMAVIFHAISIPISTYIGDRDLYSFYFSDMPANEKLFPFPCLFQWSFTNQRC